MLKLIKIILLPALVNILPGLLQKAPVQILHRPGIGLRKLIKLQDDFLDSRIPLTRCEGIHKVKEVCIILHSIMLLQNLCYHITFKQLKLTRISYTETRIQIYGCIIFGYQLFTEGINGGDIGILDISGFTDKPRVMRV